MAESSTKTLTAYDRNMIWIGMGALMVLISAMGLAEGPHSRDAWHFFGLLLGVAVVAQHAYRLGTIKKSKGSS